MFYCQSSIIGNMKSTFISFGPNCLPAEILKSADLRHCTYGFDWFRSSSFYIEQFLSIDVDLFLEKYVYEISLPLCQTEAPSKLNSFTSEPNHVDPLFGYSFLYNPHRDYSLQDTFSYFSRSFHRLATTIKDPFVHKVILLVDYVNKPHYSFLENPRRIYSWLVSRLVASGIENYRILIVRINLCYQNRLIPISNPVNVDLLGQDTGHPSFLVLHHFSSSCDQQELRNHMYRNIGKTLSTMVCN